jgi:NADH:ubiquinone reductase (H+-translocating)
MMKVVVVGGGFAGINLAKELSGHPEIQVTLVDRNNYNFFPPLLYQVSTAFIEPSNISYPFRRLFQEKKNLHFYLGSLIRINPDAKSIETDTGTLNFDHLVLAMGTETNYFGLDNIMKNALPMKTIDDALHLRNHILLNMEKVVRTQDPRERRKLLNIVVAGGGPTGVEISGMIAEMGVHIIAKDYPEIGNVTGNIYLIDAGPALLGPMSKKSQAEAFRVLTKLGVIVKSNVSVKDYQEGRVIFSNGETLESATLIWATGVIARDAPGLPKACFTKGRRIIADEFNRVIGFQDIFVIGDQSFQSSDANYPNGHPQLAQVAIQQGKLLAANLKAASRQRAMKPFIYHNKGAMAIIAKYKAVVDLPRGFFKGFFAWLVWLFIHIIPIAGYRNKSKIAFNWFWSFITNDPTLRLIIRPDQKDDD